MKKADSGAKIKEAPIRFVAESSGCLISLRWCRSLIPLYSSQHSKPLCPKSLWHIGSLSGVKQESWVVGLSFKCELKAKAEVFNRPIIISTIYLLFTCVQQEETLALAYASLGSMEEILIRPCKGSKNFQDIFFVQISC